MSFVGIGHVKHNQSVCVVFIVEAHQTKRIRLYDGRVIQPPYRMTVIKINTGYKFLDNHCIPPCLHTSFSVVYDNRSEFTAFPLC